MASNVTHYTNNQFVAEWQNVDAKINCYYIINNYRCFVVQVTFRNKITEIAMNHIFGLPEDFSQLQFYNAKVFYDLMQQPEFVQFSKSEFNCNGKRRFQRVAPYCQSEQSNKKEKVENGDGLPFNMERRL